MRKRVHAILRDNHVIFAIVLSAACCVAAFLGAFFLRFDLGNVPVPHDTAMWLGLPILVGIRLAVLSIFRVHRGLYRYFSVHDFLRLFQAVSVGSLVFVMFWTLALMDHYFMPRSIYVLEWLLCMSMLSGVRILVRLWRRRKDRQVKMAPGMHAGRALIVGAGNLGESILRIIDRRFLGNDYDVVGFVDNDRLKQGNSIHGIPVLGKTEDVRELVELHKIETIVLAITNPDPGLFEEIIASCEGLRVVFNVVSVMRDMATGEVSIDKMRSLKIEDLLGRNPVFLDAGPVRESVAGHTVMVTGAGGSIGSELCRQLAAMKPARLVLLECGETPLFEIDRELRQNFPELDLVPFIGDIKHDSVVERAFGEYKPEFVYHAAAYKHVPLMEAHPDEAVLNNVHGTRILAEAAKRHHCKRFVMISTDKAVRPGNVMGATKRMCELVIQNMNVCSAGDAACSASTVFAAVRFGNVLGSNGSVIPIFQKQLEAGGPLTVTHPEMTRFFMMIPEAVSLVLQCGTIAEPGDVFVLDMGIPVKIMDLARNMIRLSGLRENVDVSIKVTGLRPGEKMYEELVAYGEELMPTRIPKVNVLREQCDRLPGEVLLSMIRHLEEAATMRQVEKTRAQLWRLIKLDDQRAQAGVKGLAEKDVAALLKAWHTQIQDLPLQSPFPARGRVLAVLNNDAFEGVLRKVIGAAGYELDCLYAFEDCIRLLTSDCAYTAVLCDYASNCGTVWQLRDRLRAHHLAVPVLAMSAYDHAMLTELLDVECDLPVLCKPFSPPDFEREMAALLRPSGKIA